jgi:predicted ATPase/DNA-binding XRE family transcriptional regulator
LNRISAVSPDQFVSFGDLLKFLRRQAGLTQRELSIAVGYSDTQISRLEQNQRIPDQATLTALFFTALGIAHEREWAARLLELAAQARQHSETVAPPAPVAEPALLDRIQHGRLVGRQGELQALLDLWARARQGHAHLALVCGEPGIGKTRLAHELIAVAQSQGAVMLAGGCYEYEAATPYLPFVEALRRWVEAQDDGGLRDALGAAAPEVTRLVPEIQERLGTRAPSQPLPPHEERLRLFDSLARFLRSLAGPHGLLVFLDDLHWADQSTLALLHYVLRRSRDARVLILATYRELELDSSHALSEALVEWNRERWATRVALARLPVSETAALLAALLGEASVTPELGEAIHRETDGNPFFIEETVKSLVEQGAIYRQEGHWERKAIAEMKIPQGIQEAIGRRLARLSARCVDILHTAAVLGKVLPFDELVAVTSVNEDQLLDALDEARAAQLIRAVGEEAFVFTHDKIREVLYEEPNPMRRRRLHQRVGAGLEALYVAPELRVAHSPDIAYHFLKSGDLQKGLTYSLQAAAQARQVFALEEAQRCLQHALESAQGLNLPDQVANIHEALGDVHFQHGEYPQAIEHFQRARNLIAPAERARQAVLNMKIGVVYGQVGDERGQSFLYAAERNLDPATQTNELAYTLAVIVYRVGRPN